MVSRQLRTFRSAVIITCFIALFSPLNGNATRALILADLHYNNQANISDYGQDTGRELLSASLSKAQQLIETQSPAFVVILGDLPSHTFFLNDRKQNLKATLAALHQTFDNTHLPVYLVPGNNDAPTGNYHSYSDRDGHSMLDLSPGWPALHSQHTCSEVDEHTPCLSEQTGVKRFGYYAAYPLGTAQHLQLVVLNSVMFAARYYESDDGVTQAVAAAQQLDWLAAVLAQAHTHHDAVIIALHIPPGLDAYNERPMWSTMTVAGEPLLNRFLALLDRYRDHVRVVLSGHTHMEEVRRLYNRDGRLITVDVSTASISPIHDNNPSMKILTLDSSYQVTQATSYYTWPNAPTWQTETFDANEQYHCGTRSLSTCWRELSDEELLAGMKPYYFALGSGRDVDWQPIANSTAVHPITLP